MLSFMGGGSGAAAVAGERRRWRFRSRWAVEVVLLLLLLSGGTRSSWWAAVVVVLFLMGSSGGHALPGGPYKELGTRGPMTPNTLTTLSEADFIKSGRRGAVNPLGRIKSGDTVWEVEAFIKVASSMSIFRLTVE